MQVVLASNQELESVKVVSASGPVDVCLAVLLSLSRVEAGHALLSIAGHIRQGQWDQ